MVELKAAAQQIEAQLSLASSLSGSLHSYGHSTNVVENGVTDAAMIDAAMQDAYNDAISNVLSASYLTAQEVLQEQHVAAIDSLHTAINDLTSATAVLATVSTVADMAASADTTQEQLQVQQALATTDMTITTAEVDDFNTALADVNTYATQAGAFLSAASNSQITSGIDNFAEANGVSVAAYTAVTYQQDIDQMVIAWDSSAYSFQGYNANNTITAETIYAEVNYYGN